MTQPAATAATPAIQLRNIRREFPGGVVAIDGIDMDVAEGEFLAILGPSGCGKSTLLRLIANLDHATSGSITFQARPSGLGLAYVFQDAHLLPWRSVLRNVALPLELSGVDREKRIDSARNALAQVGLSDFETRFPAELSGGMRMRVSLARALVTKPKLLLLDEPFAALDEITRQQLDEQLRALWKLHCITVIFVTHSINEAAFLAERAIVMSKRPGRVVLDHPLDLPTDRPLTLRGEARFARESAILLEALYANSGATR